MKSMTGHTRCLSRRRKSNITIFDVFFILLVSGLIQLFKPYELFNAIEQFRSYSVGDPSDSWIKWTRIRGAILIAIAVAFLVFSILKMIFG